jgi:Ribbon-helix-helix protein, copG family
VSSSVVVNLRIPAELAEATRERAEREERTASAVIRRALKLHLATDDIDNGGKHRG